MTTRCIATHPLPYGKPSCDQPAVSLVQLVPYPAPGQELWVPVCQDWADEFGVQGLRVRALTPTTAFDALARLLASAMPDPDDSDNCGMVQA